MLLPCALAFAQSHPPDRVLVAPSPVDEQEGTVLVHVWLDADGHMTSATVIEGDPALHAAAIQAVQLAQFEPCPVQPLVVQVDFAAASMTLVIQETAPPLLQPQSSASLHQDALETLAGQDLGEVVATVPGVTAARGSADTTKPVIRGHTERRVVLLSDGVRHEGQKWGSDHAPELDPFSAGSVHVLRGPSGVRYGADAIGGVVRVDPSPMLRVQGVQSTLQLGGDTQGLGGHAAARVDWAPTSRWSFRVQGSGQRAASWSSPSGVVGNSASALWTAGASLQRTWRGATLRATWHHYDLTAGVPFAFHASNVDELAAQLAGETSAGPWERTYAIERPNQAVRHDTAALHWTSPLGEQASLQATAAFQRNHRREYDTVRGDSDAPQADFVLRTWSLDVAAARHVPLAQTTLDLEAGAQGAFQENVYNGVPLISNHRAWSGGAFGVGRWSLDRLVLEAGARVDHTAQTLFLSETTYAEHQRRGTAEGTSCERTATAVTCPNRYTGPSASVGVLVHVIPDTLDVALEGSRAVRFPDSDELTLAGTAPTLPVYALGDLGLTPERTWGASATVGLRTPWVHAQVSGYGQRIHDYIAFTPALTDQGTPQVVVTARGAAPLFVHSAVDARFVGLDGGVEVAPDRVVGLQLSGAMVRGTDASGAALPNLPTDQATARLVARPPVLQDTELGVSLTGLAATDETSALAPASDAALLLGASLTTTVGPVRLGATGTNLTNAAYRNPTSLLRFASDEPGRGVRVWVRWTI